MKDGLWIERSRARESRIRDGMSSIGHCQKGSKGVCLKLKGCTKELLKAGGGIGLRCVYFVKNGEKGRRKCE